jgi:hypothetical protein
MQRRLGCPILAMHAPYIVRRTQIYLDEEQDRRLAERARATGRTKSDLIREAPSSPGAPRAGLAR